MGARREPGWVARRALAVWVVLVAVAFALPFLPGSGPLTGIYAIVLSLPWSLALLSVLDAIDPALTDGPVGVGLALLAALANGALLFVAVRWIERRAAR